MKPKKIKALSLLSGGLDSTLSTKLILDQGIEVIALNFTSPFCLCNQKGKCSASSAAEQLKINLITLPKGKEYLKVLRNPKYGYGSAMNPCIDCRIFILKKAKKMAKKIKADFIFTGEVLNERPMSQYLRAMKIIERDAGLEGKLLRPLSAKLLPETEAEKKGLVNRSKLLAIKGRQRKPQFELAERFRITEYPCPSGGCLLTHKEFAEKIKDLFKYKKRISMDDILLLKVGRHFRYGKNKIVVGKTNKIVVGRNEKENKELRHLKLKSDLVFEVPDYGSPVTILQGSKSKGAIKVAAALTARYSDCRDEGVKVRYGKGKLNREIIVAPLSDFQLERIRV